MAQGVPIQFAPDHKFSELAKEGKMHTKMQGQMASID
jgi:hypothetical protein